MSEHGFRTARVHKTVHAYRKIEGKTKTCSAFRRQEAILLLVFEENYSDTQQERKNKTLRHLLDFIIKDEYVHKHQLITCSHRRGSDPNRIRGAPGYWATQLVNIESTAAKKILHKENMNR